MTAAHTSGQWLAAAKPSSFVGWPVVSSPSGRLVCDVSHVSFPSSHPASGPMYAEAEANARLIASAPDLLEALTEARTTLSILRTQVMVEIGRCADPSASRWEGVPDKLSERLEQIDAVIAKATCQ